MHSKWRRKTSRNQQRCNTHAKEEIEREKKKREKFSMRSGVRNEFSRLLLLECWTNKLRLLKLWIILFLSEENGKKFLRTEYETEKKPDRLSDAAEAAIQTLIQINSMNLKSFNSYFVSSSRRNMIRSAPTFCDALFIKSFLRNLRK